MTRIVFCNKYFFLNGGTEKYLYDLMGYLPHLGHQVLPFSVDYDGSWPSRYRPFFMPPPASPRQAHLNDIRLTPFNAVRFIDRGVYSLEAQRRLGAMLDAVDGADIAYLLNIYNYMSPSIIHTLGRRGIPVVMQLGDYNLLCPSYSLLRDGRPCNLCVGGDYINGLRYRCVKKNLAASGLRVAAMYVHKWLKIYNEVAAFVVPCRFMKNKLVQGGFPAGCIHLIPYPADFPDKIDTSQKRRNYILYFGRISHEKGLDTLIRAYQQADLAADLVLAGRSYDGEKAHLMRLVAPGFDQRIRFVGFKSGPELSRLIGEALLSVVPSRWYDNAPISIYESFGHATPVVAANIGGIPEQVDHKVNGMLFAPDDAAGLAAALTWMLSDRRRLAEMGVKGREYVTSTLTIEKHSRQLLSLFERVMEDNQTKGRMP